KFLKRVMIIGKKFIPNLGGRKYKTRVYVLNRIMKQLQDDYKDFEKFLRKKTKLLREVDETSEYINTIIKKMEERSELKKKIQNTIKEAETIQEKIDKMDDKQSNLESQKIVVQLEELDQQINVECNKLTLETGSLDKPLRKLTSRAHDGIVKLPPGLKKLAEQLQDNPHKAFLSMEKNHPKLNSLIDILIDAIKTEKIKLKSSMKSRALELAEDIKNGSIIEMLNKVIEHEKKKEELDEKIDELGIRKEIEKFKKERQEYEKDKERKERTIRDLKSKLKKLNDEIAEIAAKTQKRVKELTDKEVKIDIKE
ncbi:MAG: hypothetical protein U9O98_01360, partial [Asgard group archaeon]|nr:hypothetical protein [Asgard group archaeon]